MKHDKRYIQNEASFLQYATDSLCHRFESQQDFFRFYSSLPDDNAKNEFLRVSSFYLFLVKNGDWVTDLHGDGFVRDYLTNSYKLVGIFSLIESLGDRKHQDFYAWLRSDQPENDAFPIMSPSALNDLFIKYNQAHGATRHCVEFFERLSPKGKQTLMQAIRIRGEAVSSIKRAVQVLYGLRSRFVHDANLLVHLNSRPMLTNLKGKVHLFDLGLSEFAKLFEEALIMHFVVKYGVALQWTDKSALFSSLFAEDVAVGMTE